jgi:hypothetical protein
VGRAGLPARASISWKLSRTHCVKACGSGISSRHEVGEITTRPSYTVTANTNPCPSWMGRSADR